MAMNSYIRPGRDDRPRERCVGYGIPWPDGVLAVGCSSCKAAVGEPCTKRRGTGAHAVRGHRAVHFFRGKAYRLFLRLENAALAKDPDGPLWSFQSVPHQCGTHGAHVLTDCTPAEAPPPSDVTT